MIVDVAISKTDMITFTHYIDSIPYVIFFFNKRGHYCWWQLGDAANTLRWSLKIKGIFRAWKYRWIKRKVAIGNGKGNLLGPVFFRCSVKQKKGRTLNDINGNPAAFLVIVPKGIYQLGSDEGKRCYRISEKFWRWKYRNSKTNMHFWQTLTDFARKFQGLPPVSE
jgi:hypothetical protein